MDDDTELYRSAAAADAVLINENLEVVAEIKRPTSGDIYDGIVDAIKTILQSSGVEPAEIGQAMLGTTQCTNAIVERKHLAKVAMLRIGAPATLGVPPMIDWEDDIKETVIAYKTIGGGFEYDGKELAQLDEEAARSFFREVKGKVESIAISCVFSTIRDDHELKIAEICREELGNDVHISISSEIGSMGLIERENATILNAALFHVAQSFTEGFAKALEDAGNEAVEMAVAAGALRETVEIIDVEDVPLAYYAGNTNRVKIKAAGDLK